MDEGGGGGKEKEDERGGGNEKEEEDATASRRKHHVNRCVRVVLSVRGAETKAPVRISRRAVRQPFAVAYGSGYHRATSEIPVQ
ncbi:unnamed protein product [Lampetra fluviatilis]